MQYVQISFAGNNEVLYDFKTDLKLHAGEQVVCDTARGLSVGRVVALIDSSDKATNWVVQKINIKAHKARLAKEQQEAEDLAELLS